MRKNLYLVVFDGVPWRFDLTISNDSIVLRNRAKGCYSFVEIDSNDYLAAVDKEEAMQTFVKDGSDFFMVDNKYVLLKEEID